MLKLLAKLLAFGPVRRTLFRYVQNKPYGHLYTKEGELYMGRWSLIARGSRASKLLAWATGGKYTHARIHWIGKSDGDRELHDHPFNYRTFVLRGWYVEKFIDAEATDVSGPNLRRWWSEGSVFTGHWLDNLPQGRIIHAGETAVAPLGQFHRIAQVSEGGVITLFLMGEDHGDWGFLVDGRWVQSHEFFKLRSIRADGKAA
jgi:hypothetical protein